MTHLHVLKKVVKAHSMILMLLKRILNSNHTDAKKGKYKERLELEHKFGFCKTFKNNTKKLGFHLSFKTANLQDIILTTIAIDINVTMNNLYLYVPILIPNTKDTSNV